jgi:hypothetical protein
VIGDCDGKKQKSGSAVPAYKGLRVHLKSMIVGLIIYTECFLNSLINVSQIALNINMTGPAFELQVVICLHLKTYFDGQLPFGNHYTM